MTFLIKSIAFIFLFLSVQFIHAQEREEITNVKRNALKSGVSVIPNRIFFSYEHAFSKHISAGTMFSYGGISFVGYSYTFFTRYYFSQFNQSGWFIEVRGSYAHFNPYVYTTYRIDAAHNNYRMYDGQHRASIDYWNAGISGGYKFFYKKRIFFEFIAGLHAGKATFGADERFLGNDMLPFTINYDDDDNDVENVFNRIGPGQPIHLMINLGVAF